MNKNFHQAARYVIISPVKDEERYIEATLRSVTGQTLKPVRWIIVDDGSRDGTVDIIHRYMSRFAFIHLVRNSNRERRKTGAPVIRAFNAGLAELGPVGYDFIVKLDCDLAFEPDYFERLLHHFRTHPGLGIASGVYFEKQPNGAWLEIRMPAYHAAGACKVIRRECFEQIEGFIPSAGWDTVDEIRAMSRGWHTRHFRELPMQHLKPEGSGIGQLRTSFMHGEIFYLTGGSKIFLLLKTIRRVFQKPYLINAFSMLRGYLQAMSGRRRLLVNAREAAVYKRILVKRMRDQVKMLLDGHW